MTQRHFEYTAICGELLVILGAILWMQHWAIVPYVYALGAALFIIGRLKLGMRRAASMWLAVSAALMFFDHTTYIGYDMYILPSYWLVPFIGFVVNEVYDAFRQK